MPKVFFEPFTPANPETRNYRPLSVFTYALNMIAFGFNPFSFHLINIVLNGIVCFLVFIFIEKLFKNRTLAVFSSLIYSFFAIHSEAVSYVKARDDILPALFTLAGWIIFLSAVKTQKVKQEIVLLSSVVLFFGFLSKESALLAPPMFILIYFIASRPKIQTLARTTLLFIPSYLIYFALRFVALGNDVIKSSYVYFIFDPLRYADLLTRTSTAFKIAFLYMAKIIIPYNLSATYDYNQIVLVKNLFKDPQALAGIFILVFLVILVFHRKTKNSPAGLGAAIFLMSYAIYSKFFIQVSEIMAERQMYLPSLGIAIIAGYAVFKIFQNRKILGIGILAAVLIFNGWFAFSHSKVWLSNETLYKSMVKESPRSIIGYFGLANLYLEQGKIQESKANAVRAMKIYAFHAPLLQTYSLISIRQGNFREAEKNILLSIRLRPGILKNYEILAEIFAKEGKYQDSLAVIKKLMPFYSDQKKLHFLAAYNYYKLERIDLAKKYFDFDNKSEAEKIKEIEEY